VTGNKKSRLKLERKVFVIILITTIFLGITIIGRPAEEEIVPSNLLASNDELERETAISPNGLEGVDRPVGDDNAGEDSQDFYLIDYEPTSEFFDPEHQENPST
jgi:hypothetical protein